MTCWVAFWQTKQHPLHDPTIPIHHACTHSQQYTVLVVKLYICVPKQKSINNLNVHHSETGFEGGISLQT